MTHCMSVFYGFFSTISFSNDKAKESLRLISDEVVKMRLI